MKLNNKGFAFSTMLYGTLALITLILYVILGISKGANDETYYYGDEIEVKLSECVAEEVALENCYSSHTGTCDATSYKSCLGIADSDTTGQGEIISETLKRIAITDTSQSGLFSDPIVAKRYVYRGTDPHNYIKYSNKIWRIISIEPDGTLKLLDYQYSKMDSWDSNNQDNWITSTLKVFLNSNYLSTIVDTSKLVSGVWESTIIYPSVAPGGAYSLQILRQQYNSQETNVTSYAQVGILSIGDYANATNTASCHSNILNTSGCNSGNWLANYKGWTMNLNSEHVDQNNNNYVYYGNGAGVSDATVSSAQKVYPVVVLDRNSVLLTQPGNNVGTESNPYVLK